MFKPDDNHSNSEFSLTDGEFYSTQVVLFGNLDLIWRARDAKFWFYADMYSPGTDAFRAGTFTYMPPSTDEDDPSLSQQFFFKDGRFAFDLDENGDFEDDEYLDVTGGTITLSDQTADYTFSLELTLENGKTIAGTYSGNFPKV